MYKRVIEIELNIKSRVKKKKKKGVRAVLYKAESERDVEEKVINELESEAEDCIIVDVE